MSAVPSFADSLGEVARLLRENAPSHSVLNHAAARIDQLGRRLHGLGLVHDREIADGFTAAIGRLIAGHPLPEKERAETVCEAVRHLEAAMGRVETGELSS